MIHFEFARQSTHSKHFAGATVGELHIQPLLAKLNSLPSVAKPHDVVLLDFNRVESVTASYTKATVVRLLRMSGAVPPGTATARPDGVPALPIYPVVMNVDGEVRAELDEVLTARKLCCLEATLVTPDHIQEANLIGAHDKVVVETLLTLQAAGTATASQLQAVSGGTISTTGWSNRLYDLFNLRLVRRAKHDRQWIYEPLAVTVHCTKS
jgi:hypothetical protein